MVELAPWLQAPAALVLQRYRENTLPHALLLHGSEGIGKQRLTEHLVQILLCEQSQSSPCQQCTTCELLRAGTHPDLKKLALIDGDAMIKVDAVRELIEWLHLTPQYQSFKIGIIRDAHAMNRNAANSLLKTLEEPADRALLLLLTDAPGALLPTVRSRCQTLALNTGSQEETLTWLAAQGVEDPAVSLSLAGGGPFRAISLADSDYPQQREVLLTVFGNIVQGAASVARSIETIGDLPTRLCLRCFASWTTDVIRLRADTAATISHEPDRAALLALREQLEPVDWFTLYDQICRFYRIDSTSFKTQTVLEGLFADIRLKQLTV